MDPLVEARAVALLLEHRTGFLHVHADGTARWADAEPDPSRWTFAEDVPEGIELRQLSYPKAIHLYRSAVRRLRRRGVFIG